MSPECTTPVDGHDPSIADYTSDPEIARTYDEYHGYLDGLFDFDSIFVHETVEPGSRVLDLGCGTGRHVVMLAERGVDVTGVDLSPHMLNATAKKLDRHGVDARLVQADICDLSALDDASYDCVVCMFSTLGLVRTRALRGKALAEWRRVLKPGGLLALHVHNVWHNLRDRGGRWWLLQSMLASLLPGREFGDSWIPKYCGLENLYLHLFSWRELSRLLRRTGFAVERRMFLNNSRTGAIQGAFARIRANGFLVAARKPGDAQK